MKETVRLNTQEKDKIWDVVIVGSGPAGLSAAIYARRAGLETLVLEKQPVSGGQILNTTDVDNYPGIPDVGGFELGQKFRQHADRLGAVFYTGEASEILPYKEGYQIKTDAASIYTKTVILAMGASYRKIGVPGEDRLRGMGVSYCATCDGAFFRGREVAVVGGGDVALEDALFLARGCKKVYLIHRRDTFRGAKVLQERVRATDNIEILYDTVIEAIQGEMQVEEITAYDKKTDKRMQIAVSGVFLAVGMQPNTWMIGQLVDLDDAGYVIAGEDGRTSAAGIFAAGDLRTKKLRQVVTAAADGANAVASVEGYLNDLNRTLR